jgi:hypothetical protein
MKWKNTFLVGVYKCELTYSHGKNLQAKWLPHLPNRQLSDQEIAQYRSGRDSDNLIAEVAKAVDGSVLVIET